MNPQGVREYRLKNEIEKQHHSLVTGMKKRIHVRAPHLKNILSVIMATVIANPDL